MMGYVRSVRFIFVCVITFGYALPAERGTSCVTPNNEKASCIPAKSCEVIYQAILTQNSSAIDFAKKSQCGHDGDPLVCCGTSAYLQPSASRGSAISSKLPDDSVCGIQMETERRRRKKRIIGGVVTELGEFPWMAALEYKSLYTDKNAGIRSVGSLINKRYVLTAGFSIALAEFAIIRVWLGEWKISTDPDCQQFVDGEVCADKVQKIKVKKLFLHPQNSRRLSRHDIGLIMLDEDVTFTDYIRPICLPPQNTRNPEVGTLMTVAGWGVTENGTSSDVELKVEIPLLNNSKCGEKLNKPVVPSQLCAGGESGKDSCQGDSGAALMRSRDDGLTGTSRWYIYGIASYGVGCGRSGIPAVYTRVASYISWIVDVIENDDIIIDLTYKYKNKTMS